MRYNKIDLNNFVDVDIILEKIEKKNRKTIGLHITDRGTLIVKIPLKSDEKFILETIKKHKKWIEKTKKKILDKKLKQKNKKFVNGEKYLILGQEYTLSYLKLNSYNYLYFINDLKKNNLQKKYKIQINGKTINYQFHNILNMENIINHLLLINNDNKIYGFIVLDSNFFILEINSKSSNLIKNNIKHNIRIKNIKTDSINSSNINSHLNNDTINNRNNYVKNKSLKNSNMKNNFIDENLKWKFLKLNEFINEILNQNGLLKNVSIDNSLNKNLVKNLLLIYYKIIAKHIFTDRIGYYSKIYNFNVNNIKISNAEKRWGSCSYKNNINLVWRLVMAPIDIIDYVVVHELVHINHKHHKKKFWIEVEKIIPDYRENIKWLKENGYTLTL